MSFMNESMKGTALGKSQWGKRVSGSLNVSNWVVETGVVLDRFLKNYNGINSNNEEKIQLTTVYDLVSDATTLAKKAAELAEAIASVTGKGFTPYSILLNIVSAVVTQISNGMSAAIANEQVIDPNKWKSYEDALKEKLQIDKEDFSLSKYIELGMKYLIENEQAREKLLEDIRDSIIPDLINPWKEPDAVDLIGTNGNDIINEESWFDKEKYVIFAHDGNDTVTGSRYNDYLDGGADDDKLYGGAGKDVLVGGSGNDLLDGGESKDQLYGGEGMDIYIAQHHDTIIDSDGKGSIFLKTGQGLIHAERFVQDEFDDPNMWFSVDRHGRRDGKLVAQRDEDGNLAVSLDGFHDSVQIEGFFATAAQNGNTYSGLGLTLTQDDGLSRPMQTDFHVGNQELGRYSNIYISDMAKSYTVHGGVLDDLIMANGARVAEVLAGSGNDRVFGSLNGDRIYGGDGNDVLNGSRFINSANPGLSAEQLALDSDIIIGNGGRDIINGFAGNDVIYTEERDSHLTETGTNKGGDWATGGLGDDKIFGSANRDFLLGGEGQDTIHGGAGNDVIVGDGFVRAGQKTHAIKGVIDSIDWDYSHVGIGMTAVPVHQPGQPVGNEYRYNAGKGTVAEKTPLYVFSMLHQDTWSWSADIDAETGDYGIHYNGSQIHFSNNEHRVAIGGDSDFLYGGAGDDLIIGQDGNDYVNGGSGNDILFGDDNRDGSVSGNDFLLAGTGSDRLYGGPGFDIYQFESQDLLQGDMNVVEDSDNQGAVILDGLALGDLGWTASNINGFWLNENKGLSLHLQNGTLLVSGDGFGGKIFIQNFVDGALGIKLPESDNTDPNGTNSGNEKITAIVTGEGSGAFETESGSGSIEADSYSYDDSGMGYWTQWGPNSGAFGD